MKTVEPLHRIISYLGTAFGIDIVTWDSVKKAIEENKLMKMARVEVNTLAGAILELGSSESLPIFHFGRESSENEKKIISDYLATLLEDELAYHKIRVREQVKELLSTSVRVWSKEFRIILHLLLLFDYAKQGELIRSLINPLADYVVRCLHKGFMEIQKEHDYEGEYK